MKKIFPAEIRFKIYADDIKLYCPVRTPEEHHRLQTAADDFIAWTHGVGLQVSAQKCCVFHLGPGTLDLPYYLDGVTLEVRSEIRDLGVHIDSGLDFGSHVTDVLKKSARVTNWIMRAFTLRRPEPYLTMYRTTVTPLLFCASPAWSPRYMKDVKQLQTAQNKFVRRVRLRTGREDVSLTSVESRLRRADLRFYARLMKDPTRFGKLFDSIPTQTRSGFVISPKARARNEKVRHIFPWRVTDVYSNL